MRIVNSKKVNTGAMPAWHIPTGSVFTGWIGSESSTYFKGIDFVVCLQSGACWMNYDKDQKWTLEIHDYKDHKDATLTL